MIHGDIIAVWAFDYRRRVNCVFHRPYNLRLGHKTFPQQREFKALTTNMVDDLNDRGAANPNKGL